jgi:hypothetical protein
VNRARPGGEQGRSVTSAVDQGQTPALTVDVPEGRTKVTMLALVIFATATLLAPVRFGETPGAAIGRPYIDL